MNLDLTGKNAFVGGSTQGIGEASAYELARLGATVTLIARNETRLQQVCAKLDVSKGQKHDYIVADFSQPEDLKQKAEKYLSSGKIIHILVNNTGGPAGGQIISAQTHDFLAAYQMHLFCNHILTQAVVPGMKTAGYGRIINVISTSVKIPITGLGVSNTTRGAVASWAKTLANELAEFGITVNNVLPGFTETQRFFTLVEIWAKAAGISEAEMSEKLKKTVPAARFATPDETAYAIVFLASPSAAYINGINLPVDGGRTGSL
ncbi:MAG: SDR family oxidoreductase [Bacteroidia bacterium]|nr:SDR family oxidoreductase [Bacteroidia bacterium]